MKYLVPVSALIGWLGCQQPPTTPAPTQGSEQGRPTPNADRTPTSGAAEPASPTPAARDAAAPVAPAQLAGPEDADLPSDGVAFHFVITWDATPTQDVPSRREPIFRVFRTRDGDVFLAAGPQVMKAAPDGSVERNPAWLGGLRSADATDPTDLDGEVYLTGWYVQTLGGRWPDALFMSVDQVSMGRWAYPIETYRFADGRWASIENVHRKVVRSHPRALAQWKNGSVVSLRGFTSVAEPVDETGLSESDERAFKRALSSLNPLAVIRGAPKAPKLGSRIAAFDALPTGELVAVSSDHQSVTHLAADGTISKTRLGETLPRNTVHVYAAAPREVYVFGETEGDDDTSHAYLSRFDGSTWTEMSVPRCAMGATAFATFPNGEAWMLCAADEGPWQGGGTHGKEALWHRRNGSWALVALPEGALGLQLVATAADEVWVATDRGIVFSKKPPARVRVPPLAELNMQIQEYGDTVPPLSCDWSTTLLDEDPKGEHAALVSALQTIERAPDEDAWALRLVEVAFRGEPRLALQSTYNTPPARVVSAVTAALGERLQESYCVARNPERTLWSLEP